jgi:hypothetical protein
MVGDPILLGGRTTQIKSWNITRSSYTGVACARCERWCCETIYGGYVRADHTVCASGLKLFRDMRGLKLANMLWYCKRCLQEAGYLW